MKKILFSSIALTVIFNLAHAQESKKEGWFTGAYKMTDTIPHIIYVVNEKRDSADITIDGKKYPVDLFFTLRADKVKSFDTGTFVVEIDYQPRYISLKGLIKKYTKVNSDYIVYKIDNRLIKGDPNKVLVDEGNIMSISVDSLKAQKDLDDIYIITLRPRNDENVKDANTLRIR